MDFRAASKPFPSPHFYGFVDFSTRWFSSFRIAFIIRADTALLHFLSLPILTDLCLAWVRSILNVDFNRKQRMCSVKGMTFPISAPRPQRLPRPLPPSRVLAILIACRLRALRAPPWQVPSTQRTLNDSLRMSVDLKVLLRFTPFEIILIPLSLIDPFRFFSFERPCIVFLL